MSRLIEVTKSGDTYIVNPNATGGNILYVYTDGSEFLFSKSKITVTGTYNVSYMSGSINGTSTSEFDYVDTEITVSMSSGNTIGTFDWYGDEIEMVLYKASVAVLG